MDTFLNVKIDEKLKRKINVRAAEIGSTQKDFVSNIIEAEIETPRLELVNGYVSLIDNLKAENETLRDELTRKLGIAPKKAESEE